LSVVFFGRHNIAPSGVLVDSGVLKPAVSPDFARNTRGGNIFDVKLKQLPGSVHLVIRLGLPFLRVFRLVPNQSRPPHRPKQPGHASRIPQKSQFYP
jgi:hypothetical protein